MDTAVKTPPRQRFNFRLLAFLGLVSLPFLYFGYVFVDQAMTGGIVLRGDYSEVDLKSMGNFSFDDQRSTLSDVPAQFRQLDGKRVQLTGLMWTGGSAGQDVDRFELVYSLQQCCFNGPPRVQERVFVNVPPALTVKNYTWQGPIRVLGKLKVDVQRSDTGITTSVYELQAEKVVPA